MSAAEQITTIAGAEAALETYRKARGVVVRNGTLTLSTSLQIEARLTALTMTGLYGRNNSETASILLAEKLRDLP